MSVKVSVCIPVYGVEKYIERCARKAGKRCLTLKKCDHIAGKKLF